MDVRPGIPDGPLDQEPIGHRPTEDDLRAVLAETGVELGEYDETIVRWLGGRRRTGGGSTVKTRQQVLEALAAVRVATAEQIRMLTCPGTASDATVRGGLQDLAREGLVHSIGRATVWRGDEDGGQVSVKLWSLTPAGAEVLASRAADVTAPPGVAAAGALHALAVTDTVAALLQVPAVPTGPTPHGPGRTAWARRSPGVGTLASVRTHVSIPPAGAGRATADILLRAPADRVPLLLVVAESYSPGTTLVERRLGTLAAALHSRSSTPWPPGTPPAVAVVLRRPADVGPSTGAWLAERRRTIADSVRTWPTGVPLLVTDYVTAAAFGPLAPVWCTATPGVVSLLEALESGT